MKFQSSQGLKIVRLDLPVKLASTPCLFLIVLEPTRKPKQSHDYFQLSFKIHPNIAPMHYINIMFAKAVSLWLALMYSNQGSKLQPVQRKLQPLVASLAISFVKKKWTNS